MVQSDALASVSGIRSGKDGAAPAEKSGAAAAGAVLRGARRARKRFERAEVRRFTWRSRRRRTIWTVALGSSVVLLGGVIAAAYSPLMALRTIDVVGADRVGTEQVVGALDDQIGTPLPLIDFTRVKEQLASFTLIESFVTESRPPGTLVVRIVEREPIGVITSETGFDLVDAAGVRIESSAERPAGYPQIEAPDGVGSAGFLAAGEVIHALPDGIRTELDSVAAATTDDVTLGLIGGAKVVWGSAEQSELKAVVLAALMVGHPTGSVNEYDVSSPNSAVLR
ncbi:FtsQ-type POTRA domain-containing protein [Cryobacterium psychrophilum]|uniref:FtsQ-type POTRA domain-containing protein n=1 Tax=Cryobacterium psychrophilum TaxID=41988 RepID=UPI001416F1FF|nr:FtsQ-type POTRA domain-containing protein [Cryobacterium psychrophilum]